MDRETKEKIEALEKWLYENGDTVSTLSLSEVSRCLKDAKPVKEILKKNKSIVI